MKTRMPSELALSRTKIATTGGVVSKILRLLTIIGAAANYFVRPRPGVNVEPAPEIIPITDAEIKPNADA